MWSNTYALPSNAGEHVEDLKNYISTGVYLVEYERFLEGIPVARDILPNSDVEGDVLQLYIDDSGLLRIEGVCRSYEEQDGAVINISLEDALSILEENMDYINAFPDDGSDEFIIQEVGLCWRLVPELNLSMDGYHCLLQNTAVYGICWHTLDWRFCLEPYGRV